MTADEALTLWQSKKRRMGCVSASNWWCKRVIGYQPERLTRYTQDGDLYQHVVATNGFVRIDLSPYNDGPKD
jgi:hypothetical protein